MNDPTPNVPPPVGWVPTGSTYGSAAGGALAAVVTGIFQSFGHPLDNVTTATLTALLSAAGGYFLNGGRK